MRVRDARGQRVQHAASVTHAPDGFVRVTQLFAQVARRHVMLSRAALAVRLCGAQVAAQRLS